MAIERTYWTAERLQSRKGMDGRRQVETEQEAILISSLTKRGLHAPCLDIDNPAEALPSGEILVKMETGADPNAFVDFARVFAAAGLGAATFERPPYDVDLDGWPPYDEITLRFDVPVRLLGSSTLQHWHLYIDHELTWEVYATLIDQLADVGLLEDGFADNSIDRAMTMLIRPGLTKADLKARGIEIDNYDDEGDDDVADDSTRGGSPDGAVDPDRATEPDSAAEETEEAMETTETQPETAPPPPTETQALATTQSSTPKIRDGETLVRSYNGEYPVPLTADDRKKYGASLAELNVRVAAIEEKKKQATAKYATELKSVKLDINRLSNALHSGKELRSIDVYDVLDRSGGVVETRRLFDGVQVGIRAADREDRQTTLPGTVPGLVEDLDDDDDDDDDEAHELDQPHDGVTVTASMGDKVHHMPDREDEHEEPDNDPDDGDGDEVASGGERAELHDLAESTRSELEGDDQGDDDDDDLDDDDDEDDGDDDATVMTPPGGAPKYDEPEAEAAASSPPAKKKRGAASTPPKKNGVKKTAAKKRK